LKRFEDASRDGDNILAIVRGSAINNDGAGTSFGTPNEKGQERVYRAALQQAKVAPAEVTFVEAHGTGTVVGKMFIHTFVLIVLMFSNSTVIIINARRPTQAGFSLFEASNNQHGTWLLGLPVSTGFQYRYSVSSFPQYRYQYRYWSIP